MANIAELFNILHDAGTGGGAAPELRVEGDSPGDGLNVFTFKDSSGNLALPSLNTNGDIGVSLDEGITRKKAVGVAVGIVATDVDVASITGLTVSKLHRRPFISVACTRTTLWSLVQIDDATTTILWYTITGSGSYSFSDYIEDLEFTTGASGTQTLKIVGNQLQSNPSNLYGTLTIRERP